MIKAIYKDGSVVVVASGKKLNVSEIPNISEVVQIQYAVAKDRKEQNRTYNRLHPEVCRKAQKKWVEKNREKHNAYQAKWRSEHPDKVKEYYVRHEMKKYKEAGANDEI